MVFGSIKPTYRKYKNTIPIDFPRQYMCALGVNKKKIIPFCVPRNIFKQMSYRVSSIPSRVIGESLHAEAYRGSLDIWAYLTTLTGINSAPHLKGLSNMRAVLLITISVIILFLLNSFVTQVRK